MKRLLLIVIILVVLGGGGYYAMQSGLLTRPTAATTPTATEAQANSSAPAPQSEGATPSIVADARLVPVQRADLSLSTGGYRC